MEVDSSLQHFPGRVLVFQPRPGLGDLIWHLPLIRAIAGASTDGRVTLLTKRSTQAATLLRYDDAIESIAWFDRNPRSSEGRRVGAHDGPIGYARLVGDLRATRADTVVLLHHSAALAAACRLAGIPHRLGYGFSRSQRRWLNAGPHLSPMPPFTEAFAQADAFARALGFTKLPEPIVSVEISALHRAATVLGKLPKPWIALGIGAHGIDRQWGAANFAELARAVLAHGPASILLLAASHEAALARQIADQIGTPDRVRELVGWTLPDVVAVLSLADKFVGNDSGLLNVRAALGQPAFGLFGASGPLLHSRLIRGNCGRWGGSGGDGEDRGGEG